MPKFKFKKVEWLYLWFLAGLCGLTLFNLPRLKGWPWIFLIYGLTLGIYGLVIYLDTRWPYKFFELLRRWLPYAGILPIFQSLGYITQYLRPDLDGYLIKIDYALFGVHPTVWLERVTTPWMVDVLTLAYSSYYFLPVILAVFLHFDQKHHELEHLFLAVTIGFFISYLGYLLVPAIGPRFTLTAQQSAPVKGLFWGNQILNFLTANEFNKRDCFPSGHTGITLIVLYYAYAYHKRLFAFMLPVAMLLIMATVFLRLHYVIDVIFGFVLAALAVLITEIWNPQFLRNKK
ncbi:phosphatase PAP2 family protein [candidate division TA06 bacterium]|uniref:Phosphatase PAP2 family protein n=1 Tax=candidate division TA06 bacterium TaxID=2250710 RepID=A0A933IAI9_UNCT6|nr:phosphatase PAP2 family protein [candidate division TA06 bacterium]